jgi:hypothetical protein
LPAQSQAILNAQKKKGSAVPPLDPAIGELQSALLARIAVPDDQLRALAQNRARAIQDALLGAGKIEPARLFLLNANPTKPDAGRVRLELSLK